METAKNAGIGKGKRTLKTKVVCVDCGFCI